MCEGEGEEDGKGEGDQDIITGDDADSPVRRGDWDYPFFFF